MYSKGLVWHIVSTQLTMAIFIKMSEKDDPGSTQDLAQARSLARKGGEPGLHSMQRLPSEAEAKPHLDLKCGEAGSFHYSATL